MNNDSTDFALPLRATFPIPDDEFAQLIQRMHTANTGGAPFGDDPDQNITILTEWEARQRKPSRNGNPSGRSKRAAALLHTWCYEHRSKGRSPLVDLVEGERDDQIKEALRYLAPLVNDGTLPESDFRAAIIDVAERCGHIPGNKSRGTVNGDITRAIKKFAEPFDWTSLDLEPRNGQKINGKTVNGESMDSTDEFDEDEPALSYVELQTRKRLESLQIEAEARRRLKAIDVQQLLGQIVPPVSLTEFLAVPDTEAAYRIDMLLPTGGRVMLSAQYKAGKTSTIDNLIKALADNRPFLNHFHVQQAKVMLIDTEMNEDQMRRWLRAQMITNTGNVAVKALRGTVSMFDILNPSVMDIWVAWLTGYDVIILDCLRPVLDALGLSEDHDAGRFLVAFDELIKRCGATEAIIVDHMGHTGERTRGDSRKLDWPDVNWRLVKDKDAENPDDPSVSRYFSAYGRDVEVAEGLLDYTHQTRELSYVADRSRGNTKAIALIPQLTKLVSEEPGLSGDEIENHASLKGLFTRTNIRESLRAAIKNGHVYVRYEEGKSHAKRHYANPSERL